MIDHTASALYLLKAENNEVFGPVNFQQLNAWATSAQISPLDKVSTDQQTWFKAPMVPELGMDWLIELTSDQLYGPTTLGALQEFLNLGEINAETHLINARDGTAAVVRDLNTLTIPPEEPEDAEAGGRRPDAHRHPHQPPAAHPRTREHAFRGTPHVRGAGGALLQAGSEIRRDRQAAALSTPPAAVVRHCGVVGV